MWRRILVLLAAVVLLSPASLVAQAEWKITDFALTPLGFRGVLLFRNGQTAYDSPVMALREVLISVPKDAPKCVKTDLCGYRGSKVGIVGAVQQQPQTINGTVLLKGGVWSEDSCNGCIMRRYSQSSFAALGCAVPWRPQGMVGWYAGRTCVAEGFDGWFSLPFEWSNFESVTPTYTWSEASVVTSFYYTDFGAGNAVLIPEPASIALFAGGLLLLAALHRRRRAS